VNETKAENCTTCGLYLPGIERTEGGLAHPVYVLYTRLRTMGQSALKGEISKEEYKKFLDEMSIKMARREQSIRELEIPPEALDDFRQELEVGFEGIDLYNRALVNFRQFSVTGEASYMTAGLEFAWQGNEKINEARLINRRNRAATGDLEEEPAPETPA
jgi:hypothetical protein